MTPKQTQQSAFTIVELVIIIAVIGILAAVGTVGWGGWQKSIATNAVKSDIKQASQAMETAKNFGSGYPASLPSSFKAGDNVTVTYVSGDSSEYCLQAVSITDATVRYHIRSSGSKEPQVGACTSAALPTPTIASVTVNNTSASLTWGASCGASSYEVRKKLSTSSSWDPVVTTTTASRTVSGLTLGYTYQFQVRAIGASMASAWSSTVSRVTIPAPSNIQYGYVTCGNSGGSTSWMVSSSFSWAAAPNTIAPTYLVSFRADQQGTVATFANPSSAGGTISTSASSTSWPTSQSGTALFSVQGRGPNGELSSKKTVVGGAFGPNRCAPYTPPPEV